MLVKKILLAAGLLCSAATFAAERPTLKIGALASGTLDWEMAVLTDSPNPGFTLEIQRLANPEAGKIALQSGAVDMIVADWIWVSRQRNSGIKLTFYPYSSAAGALLVGTNSGIETLADLTGKRLGIAGGELDKNWLLLQALGQKQGLDLNAHVEKVFGAPPLLSQQLKQQRLDAILTYWNFAARLEAEGFKKIIDANAVEQGLGLTAHVPPLGYVFREEWAQAHKSALKDFFQAAQQAKQRLCSDDNVWRKALPETHEDDPQIQAALRQGYCQGRVTEWSAAVQTAAGQLYSLLYQFSRHQLTGDAPEIAEGTFWPVD